MTKFYNIFFLLAVTLLSFNAQAQIAIVNSQKIISSMPVFQKIDTLINKEKNSYTSEFNKKQLLANGLLAVADSLYKVDKKAANTLKAIDDANAADKELKAYAEMANKKILEYKQLLEQPYIDKIMAVIKNIAITRKLMQVIEQRSIDLYYFNPTCDITEDVIKQLKQ